MSNVSGKRVLIFVGDDYEDLELQYPKYRLLEAGCEVVVAGQIKGHKYMGKHGYPCVSDEDIEHMKSADFDGLVVPGGWMPDKLRRDPTVLQLTSEFHEQKKLIASICHGAWINISAGVVKGLNYTSTPGIKDDLTNAGARWYDSPVVVDGHHVSSRRPDDLPAFMQESLKVLAG